MSRKRNLKRHVVTTAEKQVGGDWKYDRFLGLVYSPRDVDVSSITPSGTVIEDRTIFQTKDTFIYFNGIIPTEPVYIWNNREYEVIADREFVEMFNQNDHNRYIGDYASNKDWGGNKPIALEWTEISSFENAVNSTSDVLELLTSKVIV